MLLIWRLSFCRWIKKKFVGESTWIPVLGTSTTRTLPPRPAWPPPPQSPGLLEEALREVGERQLSDILDTEIMVLRESDPGHAHSSYRGGWDESKEKDVTIEAEVEIVEKEPVPKIRVVRFRNKSPEKKIT
jgi:hypothetical protein